MKVKIKDLKPNPYRDMANYPFDQDKINTLKNSIQQTGFWDNILAREVNGIIEIAYGHHRLEALRQVMDSENEIDIPVKKLSDAIMIKIMANENMDEWKTSVKIIDETVRVTKLFLEQHPEEKIKAENELAIHGLQKGISKESQIIGEFLKWGAMRIGYSLERLKLIDSDIIDKDIIESLPTERAARDFVSAVKKYNLPKEKHKSVVEKYLQTDRGESNMKEAVITEMFIKSKVKDEKVKKLESEIAEVESIADDLIEGMAKLLRLYNELDFIPDDYWQNRLIKTIEKTRIKIDEFLINLKK